MAYTFNPFTGNFDFFQNDTTNSPGGSDTYIQYNQGGAFGGDSDFTWDYNTRFFTVNGGANRNAVIKTTDDIVSLGDVNGAGNSTTLIIDDVARTITASQNVIAPTFTGDLIGNVTGNLTGNADTATFATTAGSASTATLAAQATILQTTRTIWGQNFNGSANVTGSLTAVQDITGGASNMIITAGTGNSRTLTLRTTTSGGTATNAATFNATQDAGFRTVNANFSAQPSATAPRFFYLFASGAWPTNTTGAEISVRGSDSTQSGIYGANFTATQVTNNAASGVLYGGKFTAEALANVQTSYAFYSQYTTGASARVVDGGSTLVQMTNNGETVDFRGLYLNLINGGNISGGMIGTYLKYQHTNSASTLGTFSGMKVELVNGTQTITTARGIAFEGYANSGTITNHYLIYAHPNTAVGTNRWGLYLDTNMDSYHLGKLGLGTSMTAPTAKLHIAAGSTAASSAPLKFNSGTSMTAAEAGAFEFTTDDLFFTITTGTARKRLLMADPVGGLTSGRVAFATTNGRLTDDSDFTFATDTLTVTKIAATQLTGDLTFADGINVITNATTGTKIGTATSQKIGFWNTAPIAQPTTAVAAATFVANTSGIANDTATFDGYTLGQVVKALRNAGLLA